MIESSALPCRSILRPSPLYQVIQRSKAVVELNGRHASNSMAKRSSRLEMTLLQRQILQALAGFASVRTISRSSIGQLTSA